jgi:hypothetical protein
MYKTLLLAVFTFTVCSCSKANTEEVKPKSPEIPSTVFSSQRGNGDAYEITNTEVWDAADPVIPH